MAIHGRNRAGILPHLPVSNRVASSVLILQVSISRTILSRWHSLSGSFSSLLPPSFSFSSTALGTWQHSFAYGSCIASWQAPEGDCPVAPWPWGRPKHPKLRQWSANPYGSFWKSWGSGMWSALLLFPDVLVHTTAVCPYQENSEDKLYDTVLTLQWCKLGGSPLQSICNWGAQSRH